MQLNSKECLESIKNTKTNHIKNGKLGQPIKMYLVKELKKEEIETIKQDLDKLESLERFKTRLLQDTNKLYNENQKLKKVIDILKKKNDLLISQNKEKEKILLEKEQLKLNTFIEKVETFINN